ncbi:MAG: anti-sigma F factor [Bacillota bacterium]|nr:anti-sigma F factor [Bacillota bacterium]
MLFRFLSRSENVALARLLAAAAVAERDTTVVELDEIKVAVSEAVSNAIIHGYGNEPQHYVEMSIAVNQRELCISIHDDGVGILDIEQAMRPSFSTEGRMGLGFAFMQSFMDEVEVFSVPRAGTTVSMRKKLA